MVGIYDRHIQKQDAVVPDLNKAPYMNTATPPIPETASTSLSLRSSSSTQVPIGSQNLKRKISEYSQEGPELVILQKVSPWTALTRLGTLFQGNAQMHLGVPNEAFRDLVIVKETPDADGRAEFDTLKQLSHPNVIKLKQAFLQDERILLGFEYCRYTLEEVLNVHLKFEEPHVRVIAKSVRACTFEIAESGAELYKIFDGIKYISDIGFVHNAISLRSIRITNERTRIRVVLVTFSR